MNKPRDNANTFDEAFSSMLKDFGTNVPQLSVVLTVIIGSLQFEEYFHSGAWLITSILCFGLVSIYKRQISGSVIKVGLLSIIWLLTLAFALIFIADSNPDYWPISNRIALSVYCAIGIMIPIGVLITAYKKQEATFGIRYPTAVESAITRQIWSNPFVKESILYQIKLTSETNGVTLDVLHSYYVNNRTSDEQQWTVIIDTYSRPTNIEFVRIDDKVFQLTNVYGCKTDRGYEIKLRLPPSSRKKIEWKMQVEYRFSDSELFTTYTPATDLELQLSELPSELDVRFELRHELPQQNAIIDQSMGNNKTIMIRNGLLPYQGVLIQWDKAI